MPLLTLENPVFAAYAVAGALMVLKLMVQGWATVVLMIRSDAGLLNPEDLRPGPANRSPRPAQLDPEPRVERSRRMQRNDLESIPAFPAIGVVFVTVTPPAWAANLIFAAFVPRVSPIPGPMAPASATKSAPCSSPSAPSR
ncbi:MAG: MAPEG family protein [Amaricoccus sp.]|uniref:MAPEG family protein n=1 Tax=Amaricoccus sp. TaxID=1872485 RepID=UPI0039E61899